MFFMDAEGFLHFVARRDEVFGRNLFKVNPREIEKVLASHSAVHEAHVTPEPDEVAGYLPKAWVVLERGETVTKGSLTNYCRERLDWHMVPAYVSFVERLPKTAAGKTGRIVE